MKTAFLSLATLGLVGMACGASLREPRSTAQDSAEPATSVRTNSPEIVLRVGGEVAKALQLTGADLAALPHQTVTAKSHEGKEARYEGVPLVEVLKKAGVPSGKELRGKAVSLYLVVEAADGYRAVFALPELDPEFSDRVILLADRRDGQPLSAKEGPLQIIVPGEKRHSRWVRQVTALKIGRS